MIDGEGVHERAQDIDPVGELWHEKVCYLEERSRRHFHAAGTGDIGTWAHIGTLLGLGRGLKDVKHHVYEVESFCRTVDSAFITAAFLDYLQMPAADGSLPFCFPAIPTGDEIAAFVKLVEAFVSDICSSEATFAVPKISVPEKSTLDEWMAGRVLTVREHARTATRTATTAPDSVRNYSVDVVVSGLLLMEFQDAVAEGDGDRLTRLQKVCWRPLSAGVLGLQITDKVQSRYMQAAHQCTGTLGAFPRHRPPQIRDRRCVYSATASSYFPAHVKPACSICPHCAGCKRHVPGQRPSDEVE